MLRGARVNRVPTHLFRLRLFRLCLFLLRLFRLHVFSLRVFSLRLFRLRLFRMCLFLLRPVLLRWLRLCRGRLGFGGRCSGLSVVCWLVGGRGAAGFGCVYGLLCQGHFPCAQQRAQGDQNTDCGHESPVSRGLTLQRTSRVSGMK